MVDKPSYEELEQRVQGLQKITNELRQAEKALLENEKSSDFSPKILLISSGLLIAILKPHMLALPLRTCLALHRKNENNKAWRK